MRSGTFEAHESEPLSAKLHAIGHDSNVLVDMFTRSVLRKGVMIAPGRGSSNLRKLFGCSCGETNDGCRSVGSNRSAGSNEQVGAIRKAEERNVMSITTTPRHAAIGESRLLILIGVASNQNPFVALRGARFP